ncbi:MAG: phosphatidylglycerol lysyltransferase domain-containing protein [Hydrogenoanaerobacterium sp.]
MIPFKTVELQDKQWINERLRKASFKSCDYSFVNNFIWRVPNKISFADINGFYCLYSEDGGEGAYTYPAGNGDIKPVLEALMQDANERGREFILRGMTTETAKLIETLFPNKFSYENNRDYSDYIYLVEKMINLSGKKLHSKRNHIARFEDNPDWTYEDITPQNIDECLSMNNEWCKLYKCVEAPGLNHEVCAVKQAFKYFFDLDLHGGLLRLGGRVVAYTMGEPLTADTYVIHIEKAFPDIRGVYPMINQQFLIHNCKDYIYVNREDDLGDEGLRKAKMSYYPDILLEKVTAVLRK